MSNIKIDLKQFKHVKSDKNSTTLRHKDGHEITLAHNALSKPNQAALKALAEVGPAAATQNQSSESKTDKLAKGGEVGRKMYEEGTPEEPIAPNDTAPVSDAAQATKAMGLPPPAPMTPASGAPPKQIDTMREVKDLYNQKLAASGTPADQDAFFGPNGEIPKKPLIPELWDAAQNANSSQKVAADEVSKRAELDKKADVVQKQQAQHDQITAQNVIRAQLGEPLLPDPGAPAAEQSPDVQPQGAAAVKTAPSGTQTTTKPSAGAKTQAGLPNFGDLLSKGYKEGQQAISALQGAQSELAKNQAEQIDEAVEGREAAMKQFQVSTQQRIEHQADLEKAVQEGQVDPEKFWDNHSRLAAGLGIILAGFNPTSNPNAALNFLKNQIELSVQAQGKNLESKQNLLRYNLEEMRNIRDAADMTRLHMADVAKMQLDKVAADAGTPLAKAAALKAKSDLDKEYAPLAMQMDLRRTAMSLAQNRSQDPIQDISAHEALAQMYAQMGQLDMAKDIRSRIVPGVGVSRAGTVPDSARQEIIAKQDLNNSAKELYSYSKKHTNIIPGTPEYNFGVTKALALQQKIREGLLGTVFRESEKPLLEKFIKENPAGALKSITTQPQLKAIIDSNQHSLNTLKSGYGLPVQESQSDNPPVKGKDGNMYIRQGVYMVPAE